MMTIRKALEEVLKREEASKYAVAHILGVHPIMIDNWLKEKAKSMRRPVAKRLFDWYGIQIDELFINDRKENK